MKFLIALAIALVAGVIMAEQGTINSAMGKIIGLLEATFVVHVVGLVVVTTALFGLKLGQGSLEKAGQVPWYLYLGGVLGVLIIYGVVASMSRVGVANATTAIIVGQVTTAVLIDCTGMFGFERIPLTWYKIAGVILLAGGAKLLLTK